jgi:thioredoxin-like negative regulator of GroEL
MGTQGRGNPERSLFSIVMQHFRAYVPSWLTWRRSVGIVVALIALASCAVYTVAAFWYHAELDRAAREMASRQYGPASARLARLSMRWPGRGEVEFALGNCEAELGRINSALAAWSRVPRRSELARQAALARARVALEHGQLAAAEESLALLADGADPEADEVGTLREQLLFLSGRSESIPSSIERRFGFARDQVTLLRTHWLLDSQPLPIAALREKLDRLHDEAPDDDRVWLGFADLATRSGRLAEADGWIKRCEARRPDDQDVRRARLSWTLAAGRPDEALRVMAHLTSDRSSPREIAALDARLASLRGDLRAEKSALERRVELDPGETTSWERLADLAASAGAADRGLSFRNRKAEVDRFRDAYRKQMGAIGNGDLSAIAELARTAELLGRRFEARGWWTIRARQAPDDRDVRAAFERLAREKAPSLPGGRRLADLVAGSGRDAPRPKPSTTPVLAVPQFRDVAPAARLAFVYQNDPTRLHRLPETMGGGLGLIDYNDDGWIDVYAVQGGKLPDESLPTPAKQGDRLFRNNGDGTFDDVTVLTGLAELAGGYGHGVAVGDYDNDGHSDLFVTRWRSYALYRNRGNGTFEDATERSGLHGPRDWPTSSAFADLDADGDLDLYVCHYLDWDSRRSHPCPDPDRPNAYLYCVPRGFEAKADHVFRNDHGRFVDVTADAKIVDHDGRGLGVVIADLDDDARPDIFVANDMTANFLFKNAGGFRFDEVAESAGVGSSGDGGFQAGMGIACGDLDGDGRPDLAVTNFYGESTSLFLNLGDGLFADRTAAVGLKVPSRYMLGFGAFFLDANNDGLLDLATVNGHVNDYRPAIPYAMPAQLFLGVGGGRLIEVSESAGACWRIPHVGRGMVVGDLDNDGSLDLLFVSEGEPLVYMRNQGSSGHFVTFKLEGLAPRSNRDAVGARVTLTAGTRRQVVERIGGGSFLSACDDRVHFGLGNSSRIDKVEVRWPSGRIDRYTDIDVDTAYRLCEGQGKPSPLRGWRPRPSSP